MRPVNKKQAGDKITLYSGASGVKPISRSIKADFKDYRRARKYLLENLGKYCSYCECCMLNGALLQTEHVQPKSIYKSLKTKWDNFLLACATCNGTGNKGENDVVLNQIHLPHRNNTYLSLCYKEAGVVVVNPILTGKSKTNAENLLRLIGLDKPDSETDFRCGVRREMWDKAQLYLKKYENKEYKLDDIINYIKVVGHWSIWFTVFKNHDEVRKALVDVANFPGTASECFDEKNHYEPKNRNKSDVYDKV